MSRPTRHILGLSGGKDSAALAVLMHRRVPDMEYFFCDTHKELQETYEYLDEEWETTAEVLNSNEAMSLFLQSW